MTKIKFYNDMGRGIESTCMINTNEIIEIAEILVLSEKDSNLVNSTDLQFYTFQYNNKQDCLVLGNGELYNHDSQPNVSYTLQLDNDGRTKMVFRALREIMTGEQLFIDYEADSQVDATKYNINL